MKTSQTLGAIAKALADAQVEITSATMDAKNPHFGSRYATLASVMDAAKPLAKHGIAVSQAAEVDDGRVIVSTILMHSSGEWISESISLKPRQDDPQSVGSAITYGRRYLLASMAGIAADDDDDGNAATDPKRTAPKPAAKPQTAKPAAAPAPAPSPAPNATAPATHTVELPPEPARPEAPKPATDTTTGAEMAELRKLARNAAIAAGIKDRGECFGVASAAVGRDVTDWSELSAEELVKAKMQFLSIAETLKEAE